MTESCEGVNCGRSDCPCKKETLDSSEESQSSLNSDEGDYSEAEWIDVRSFSERVIGEDGNYYDCDLCHEVGTLLCCDTCPSTFHLECLKPALEIAPHGVWQCQKCCPRDDSSASASKGPKRRVFFSRVKHSSSSSIKKQLNETSSVPVDPKPRSNSVNQSDNDCEICHEAGTLLCCDTCPSTFHLECLEPPLEIAPHGVWQCQKCCPRDDSSASASKGPKRRVFFSRVKHSSSSGKKQLNETSSVPVDPNSKSSSVNQKLPAALPKLVEAEDVLGKASEAEAHTEMLGKSSNNLSAEEGTRSGFKMVELKVYERSMRKKKVCMEEDVNLEALSDKVNEDHKVKPAHNPVEIDETPVEEQEEAIVVSQDLNERPYSESSDVILQHKLLIPRDVSQASADGHLFSQNNELSDSLLEEHLNEEDNELSDSLLEEQLSEEEAKARKERLAYLRARQKEKIAKRVKKVGKPAPASSPSSNEEPVEFHGQNFNGTANRSSGVVPIAATPLRMIRHEDAVNERRKQSSEKTDNRKENPSVNSNQKRLNHNQEGFGDQFPTKKAPNPESSTAAGVKRHKTGISEFPSPWLTTLSPQPRDVHPRNISTSDLIAEFPMPGYNHSRTMEADESWSNKELDSLWIGIRKYRQGNWLQMLTDPNLCFSRGKTGTDLAKKWEKEKAKHFGPQADKGKRRMIDIDLNLEPSFQGWMSSESSSKAKTDELKLLLGIHIEIPVIQPVPEPGGIGANQMRMQEPLLRPGGIGSIRMQMQEAVPRPGGIGANQMGMQEPILRPGGINSNRMQMQVAVSRPGGIGANQMRMQEPISRSGGVGSNWMRMQEPISRPGGIGSTRMQMRVAVSRPGGINTNQMQAQEAISRPGGIGANRTQTQYAVLGPGGASRMRLREAVSRPGGNAANRMQEVVEVSSDSKSNVNSSDSEATIFN